MKKNLPASVRERLANKARNEKRPFQELLQYYAMERFLYRLGCSKYKDKFILKGALMLRVWEAPLSRATRDADFLGFVSNGLDTVANIMREICVVDVEPDGITFDPKSTEAVRIKEDADYEGVRVTFSGKLEQAKIDMQVDVGFGDVVVPGPVPIDYPTLLDFPAPHLNGYPPETVIAEKFQAMVDLGELNSRMKDFYDVRLLSRRFKLDTKVLRKAIESTFERRGTPLEPITDNWMEEFARNPMKQRQWEAFLTKSGIDDVPKDLSAIIQEIRTFLSSIDLNS